MLDYFQILVKLFWVILKLEVHMRRMSFDSKNDFARRSNFA